MTTADLFAAGRHWQEAGDLPRAEEAYRQSLASAPENDELWCRLGSVFKAQGKYGPALEAFQQALDVRPDSPRTHNLLGIALLELGSLAEAARCLEQAVRLDPHFAVGHNNLGNVYLAQGRTREALACYQQAVDLEPRFAEAHANLGNAWRELNDLEPALRHCQQAVALKPGFAIGHNHLGAVYLSLAQNEPAAASFRQAISLAPSYFEAHFNLGAALQKLGCLQQAVAHLQRAVQLRPESTAAHSTLALLLFQQEKLEEAVRAYQSALRLEAHDPNLHNNLGVVYSKLRRWEDAAACYRQAIALQADHAEAQRNLGSVLREAGRAEEAVQALRQAVRLRPDFADAWASLALALIERGEPGDLEAARASCEQALKLNPRLAAAHHNLGVVMFDMGRREEALACYHRALAMEPDWPDVRKNRALVWLLEGKLPEGWAEYEWRWKCPESPPPSFKAPLWDGSALGGRTILLHAEQGMGDTLHFIRYARLVHEHGGQVIVACSRPLIPLLSRCPEIERCFAQDEPLPSFDVQAPLLSLPGVFGSTLQDLPADVPYLEADPRLVERWREELAHVAGFKVGIAWQGSRNYRRDRARSVPLAEFAPLARIPGVRLISLQKGDGSEQLAKVVDQFEVLDLGSRLDLAAGAFMDTAAVMESLDLTITSDTSIPHLAGALGVPVWVALPHVPDWRWLLDREDSPWYPTMRLFRQATRGDWREVFGRIATALAEKLGQKTWEDDLRRPSRKSKSTKMA